MTLPKRRSIFFLLLLAGTLLAAGQTEKISETENDGSVRLPFLQAQGASIVNGEGQPVILRGCNLGNWLLPEMWMMEMWRPDDPRDYAEIENLFAARFGQAESERLLNLWRQNWIQPRDFKVIKSWGFNVVRVPFHYGLLVDDRTPVRLRDDAFKWLDRAVEMAAHEGIYVILDMHGAPGGQSGDHSTGRSGQNKFWSPENRKLTAWLWKQIARRYANNPTVAAYDLLNEPYGDVAYEPPDKVLTETMSELIAAIRKVDRRHLIFCSASRRGTVAYGPPASHGWDNVAYTEHFYPGLFGGIPALETHARFFSTTLQRQAELMHAWKVPFLMGEFNVVFENAGGSEMMRRYFDFCAANGWAATMWSYKMVKAQGGVQPDNWYMVTNRDPLSIPHFRTASKEEIATFSENVGSMPYAQDEELRDVLNKPVVKQIKLHTYARLPPEAPHDSLPDGWASMDIGEPFAKGGEHVIAADCIEVFGGGRDVYEGRDELHLVARPAGDTFELTALAPPPFNTHEYAKAGLMFRSGPEADACLAMIAITPDGLCTFAYRRRAAERITEVRMAGPNEAKTLRLSRKGNRFEATALNEDNQPIATKMADLPEMPNKGVLGLFVCSHEALLLSKDTFSRIQSK